MRCTIYFFLIFLTCFACSDETFDPLDEASTKTFQPEISLREADPPCDPIEGMIPLLPFSEAPLDGDYIPFTSSTPRFVLNGIEITAYRNEEGKIFFIQVPVASSYKLLPLLSSQLTSQQLAIPLMQDLLEVRAALISGNTVNHLQATLASNYSITQSSSGLINLVSNNYRGDLMALLADECTTVSTLASMFDYGVEETYIAEWSDAISENCFLNCESHCVNALSSATYFIDENPVAARPTTKTGVNLRNVFVDNAANLSQAERDWLTFNPQVTGPAYDFLRRFYADYDCKYDFIDASIYSRDGVKLIMRDNTYRFERMSELWDLLNTDKDLLVDCIDVGDDHDLEFWRDLITFRMPQECTDRLDFLGRGWEDQPITDANSHTVNLDLYEVKITTYPDLNQDQLPDDPDEVFQAIRENFPTLVSGGSFVDEDIVSGLFEWEFKFLNSDKYPDNYDRDLWHSNNPVTTIFDIDAEALWIHPPGDDDGTIIVSDNQEFVFRISTIKTPLWSAPGNGSQPFSGNREWGYYLNGSGDMVFYTKAADRAKHLGILKQLTLMHLDDWAYFKLAELTWQDMQRNIQEFIVNNGGVAAIVQSNVYKVNWTQLSDLIKQSASLQFSDFCN